MMKELVELIKTLRSEGVEYYRKGELELRLYPVSFSAEPPPPPTPEEMKRAAEQAQKEFDAVLYGERP